VRKLEGKVAVVLGAGSYGNMGQAIAQRFSQEGAEVIVAGRRQKELEELAARIGGAFCLCDIRFRGELERLAAFALGQFSHIDIAINCVGWALFKPFLETTEEELDRMVQVQFKGPFQFFQVMASNMPHGGSMIQLSSVTARTVLPDHAAYMGTKAGIDQVVRSIANDLGPKGIRVNTIAPALTDTPMNAAARATPGFFDTFLPYFPLGRLVTIEDVAAAALWLSSDECFMTGSTLVIDGGMILRGVPLLKGLPESIAGPAA
jgi:NAD(P)-dependent dehydrogenase (short-subunit alcohol dehydrogenase family)